MSVDDSDPAAKRFGICIDEVRENFVFGEFFSGPYEKSVMLSDGSTRLLKLTPMLKDGVLVVELNDSGRISYMGRNGTTTNGRLMVSLVDVEQSLAETRIDKEKRARARADRGA